jgi:regulatory protein
MAESAEKACMHAALRLLARRDHSRQELSSKLARRGFAGDLRNAVIAECIRLGYLDETEQARAMTERLIRKGFGRRRAKEALRAKGLGSEVVESATTPIFNAIDEVEMCKAVLRKKRSRSSRFSTAPLFNERIFRYLLQRGFSKHSIRLAMAEDNAGDQ